MSLLGRLPSRLSALGVLQLRAPLPPGGAKKAGRDKGPKRVGELSSEVATGCSLLKGEQDPKLKPDSEYPDWLWKLMEPRASASELQQAYEGQGLSMDQVRPANARWMREVRGRDCSMRPCVHASFTWVAGMGCA